MAEKIITIELDRSRCIFLDNVIYFSNYYLNQVISETETDPKKYPKSIKVNFKGDKFMNEDELEEQARPGDINEKLIALSKVEVNVDNLNVTKYTKINIDSNFTIDNMEFPAQDIYADLDSIFITKEQVIQYLKYNGFWYIDQPTKYEFNNREKTLSVKAEEDDTGGDDLGDKKVKSDGVESDGVESGGVEFGGKKTTARRRGKASHNKHRKSKRIR